jgi:adenylate kinase family enzyme
MGPTVLLNESRISSFPAEHQRIVVIGSSGAGKTTFARRLSHALQCSYIELDALHWGPSWTVRPDFAENVRKAAAGASWVADGNYSAVRNELWGRATGIVWLNYSFPLVWSRAIKRTLRRVLLRETLFGDNRETLRRALFDPRGVPWWIIRTFRGRRREYPRLLTRYGHLRIVELRSPREEAAVLHADAWRST